MIAEGSMSPGRTYVSGWSSRTDRNDVTNWSTVRDTRAGSASVSGKPSDNINPYDAIKARCLQSNTLWEDPDFPAVKDSIFFKTPPSAWPNIQWKRPKVRDIRFRCFYWILPMIIIIWLLDTPLEIRCYNANGHRFINMTPRIYYNDLIRIYIYI